MSSIRNNLDIRKGQGYKNFFYYGAPPELGGKEELMADFNQTTSILARDFPEALAFRVLQLDDRTRMKFKLNLGFFNASPTDEEVKMGVHEDPWAEIKPVTNADPAVTDDLGKQNFE